MIVFRGSAVEGILDDPHYKAKQGVHNPNLNVLTELRNAGVELFVCGQSLVFDKIAPRVLSPVAAVASDALIVWSGTRTSGTHCFLFSE